MEKRPLRWRFARLVMFLRLATKEAHAVVLALIGGVLFLLASLLGPWLLARYYPSIAYQQPSPVSIVCGIVTITFGFLLIGGYLVWEEEERQHFVLKEQLKPHLRIEFNPDDERFIVPARHGNIQTLYVRVNARSLSPTVRNCRGFLKRISQLRGDEYVTLFDESMPLPWSYQDPNKIVPKDLNHDVDALLDVVYFTDQQSGFPAIGFLNLLSPVPERLLAIARSSILPNPTFNLKLDLVLTGDECENAHLTLNIHRGQSEWNKPFVGWMNGKEVRHDPSWTDSTPGPNAMSAPSPRLPLSRTSG